jgi:hypothetical protein
VPGPAFAPGADDAAEAVEDEAAAEDEAAVEDEAAASVLPVGPDDPVRPVFGGSAFVSGLAGSALMAAGWAAGATGDVGPPGLAPGLPASGLASDVPGFAATTGSVAGRGGVPDPCGACAAGPGAPGFPPPVAAEVDDDDDTGADDVDAGAPAGRVPVPDGLGCPGFPGAGSGFRPPDPGLSASLGGGVTGKSSNSSASPRPPSTAATPGARARYGGSPSLSPHP